MSRAFDPKKHPRHPAGAPVSQGGEFRKKGLLSDAERRFLKVNAKWDALENIPRQVQIAAERAMALLPFDEGRRYIKPKKPAK